MGYKSQAQQDIESSPLFAVRRWRNVPESTTEALDEFIEWLEEGNNAPGLLEEDINNLKSLAAKYTMSAKVKAGEQELLDQWIKACKG